jgi:hypothetical protein
MAMSGDTIGFLESSWNRGILSRMEMTRPTGDDIPKSGGWHGWSVSPPFVKRLPDRRVGSRSFRDFSASLSC